ncbi:hypothetical protein PSPO01_03282 [Paraphaeosphaeria sporulosa]
MPPSTRHKNYGAARKTRGTATPHMKRGSCRVSEQARKPAVPRVAPFVRKRSTQAKASVRDFIDHGDHEDQKPVEIVDTTLPKDDKERETWARKLYIALLNGPRLSPETAGTTAWEVLESTENLFRDGPSVGPIRDNAASAIVEQLKTVTFGQYFEDLLRFVDEQRVKSDVIGYSAEGLLMKIARVKRSNAAATAPEVDAIPQSRKAQETTAKYIDLTMELYEDETSDDTDASEDDVGSDQERREGHGESLTVAPVFTRVIKLKEAEVNMLEDVPTHTKSLTGLPTRTVPHNAAAIDLTEISESEGRADMESHNAMKDGKSARSSANEADVHRASYFDPDPFWMVHLETMRNKRRSAAARKG